MADSYMQEALKIFAAEKAEEIASLGGSLSGAKKEAFEQGFLNPLKARPLGVMQEIIDLRPDDRLRLRLVRARRGRSSARVLRRGQGAERARRPHGPAEDPCHPRAARRRDGRRRGDGDTRPARGQPVRGQSADPGQHLGVALRRHRRRRAQDVRADLRPAVLADAEPRRQAGGGGQARARIHERHRRGDDHHHPADVLAGSGARFQRRHAPEHRSHRRQPGRARPDARRAVSPYAVRLRTCAARATTTPEALAALSAALGTEAEGFLLPGVLTFTSVGPP